MSSETVSCMKKAVCSVMLELFEETSLTGEQSACEMGMNLIQMILVVYYRHSILDLESEWQ